MNSENIKISNLPWPTFLICLGFLGFFTHSYSAFSMEIRDTVPHTQKIGLVSTAWNDFQTASPSQNIPILQPPAISNDGSANLSFPIKLPEARDGMTPELNISYAQESGPSLLGQGWSISNTSIIVDTRWGVPRFNSDTESETYLLDGEQMSPVFHRSIAYPREEERTFNLRQQLVYRRIIRHGNSPKNYWWEITETDGTVHYYGGLPASGPSENHVLTTADGNIVEWHLAESRNTNNNFISYQYQKVTDFGGSNIYPATIKYNGHGLQEGNYAVHFRLKSKSASSTRNDISNNARYGMKQVWADLLEEITIEYKAQRIRSYRMEYTTGAFEKTLLRSIAEYDQNENLFYDFEMTYFDEVREDNTYRPYKNAVTWNVPKDNIPVGTISGGIDGFNSKPTILGGAKSDCFGGDLAITLGFFPGSLVSKEFTVGGKGGFIEADGEGMIALIDINGDELPDKVWRETGGLYFRPNLHNSIDPNTGFGIRTKIQGISQFNISNTSGWNAGAEATVPPVFGAYSHDESTTNTVTYFGDFNGDELIDIVHQGQVYFNYLDANGVPTFSTDSGDTPSPIFKGEPADPTLVVANEDETAQIQKQNPLHDVVRIWRAVKPGQINLTGSYSLAEDISPESIEYVGKDGVFVMIQINETELLRTYIPPDDFTTKTYDFQNIDIEFNDSIFFRVSSVDDGSYDVVNWDPTIVYSGEDTSETNIDGQPLHLFQSSRDFLISSNASIFLPSDGQISISGQILKPELSDSVEFIISEPIDTTLSFAPSEIVDGEISIDNIAVLSGTELKFTIQAKSNVDWTAVQWLPIVEYTAFTDGSPVLDSDGNPLISICAPVEKNGYFQSTYLDNYFIAPAAGTLVVDVDINKIFATEIDYTVSLKTRSKVDSVRHARGVSALGSQIESVQLQQQVELGDTLYIDYNSKINSAIQIATPSLARFALNGDTTFVAVNSHLNQEQQNSGFGQFYRGWGQFVYNANDGRSLLPIQDEALNYDEDELASDTLIIDEDVDTDELDMSNIANSGERFLVMTSDPKVTAWRGLDDLTFITRSQLSSTRFGRKNLNESNPATGGDGINAPALISRFSSDGGYGGLGIGPASGSLGYTAARAWSVLDVIDMNGDRYPDHVSETKIQYTNTRGGLSTLVVPISYGIHEATSEAFVLGVGGAQAESSPKNAGASAGKGSNKSTRRVKQKGRSNMNKSKGAFKSAAASVGLSGSVASDDDMATHTFLDMNGDGLEDKVWNDGDVALNMGYSFGPRESWNFSGITEGTARDFGAGLGFSVGNGAWEGGVGVTRTENHSTSSFMDVNDDALIDLIVSVNPLMIRFNTGHGFSEAVEWVELDKLDAATSIGESANVATTFCIPIFFTRICFNPSSFVGQGNSAVYDAFQDIDGDGFPDYLTAAGDDANLSVRSSTIGRTNFLKTIDGPMGEQMNLNYAFVGNTYEMPFSKWVLSEVTLDDGVYIDGVSTYRRTMHYQGGYYDRHERQFNGFRQVEEHYHTAEEVARNVQLEYENKSYYTKGILKRQSILDGEDRKYKTITYDYVLQDIVSGAILSPAFQSQDDGEAYVSLFRKTIAHYEGGADSLLRTYLYTSDLYGNTLTEIDMDEAGQTRTTTNTYYYDKEKYLVNRLEGTTIESNGVEVRHSTFEIDERGNRIQEARKVEDEKWAITDFMYDEYGNVRTMYKPANHQGERLFYTNKYDDEEHQYLVSEIDGYGYEMKYTHEYLYNSLTSATDINGHLTSYKVDDQGRPEIITYPYELENEIPYSIRFEYNLDAEVPFAVAYHYDPEHDQELPIYQFEDGMHRPIQTKQWTELHTEGSNTTDALIVSGLNLYDALGRITTSYLPTTENINNASVLSDAQDPAQPTETLFDVLDRDIEITDTYGGVTQFDYAIEEDMSGKKLLEVKTTDAADNTKSEFFNTRNEVISIRHDGPMGDLWTQYVYDGISQVREIIDQKGNLTQYTYDLLGRRTTVTVPDAGQTELIYDNASNLIERKTATIRDVISNDGSIRYTYDKERLIQIDYPKHFQNKVQIHYGTPQDSFNRAGRIWLQEDASGGREYFFDINGNPSKVIRTVMINRANVYTYVSEFQHDTWSRIQSMVYPDGEKLDYHYDRGGKLKALQGEKANVKYDYLKFSGYDRFGDNVYTLFGNDAIDTYQYDDKGRLVLRTTTSGSNALLSEENYKYDAVDNLLEKTNSVNGQNELGGSTTETYKYDELHRLTNAIGTWQGTSTESYDLFFDYDAMHNLTMKGQVHTVDGVPEILTSRTFDYQYESDIHPNRPTEVGGRQFSYDPNGNLLLSNSQAVFDFDQNIYDEENRMMGASNNGYISRYTYDAFGHRTIKSHGESQGVFMNGAPAGFVEHKLNYKVEVSPYFTIYQNEFRKHYFMGKKRILSKIGTGLFQTNLGNGPEITAGSIDYKSRIQQYEASILEYYASLGVPPGPPTLLALLGQPEINATSLPDANNANPYNRPPANWPNIAPPDTTGPPGVPVFFEFADLTNENVTAGYNFTAGGITKELEQFYYHQDNTHSTRFVTGSDGLPRQYATYFPSGEIWISQVATADFSPYYYAGLELDEETGYYYMGEIYYDPVTNLEQSLDPILQNFGKNTFAKRLEGDFYYDYADDESSDVSFDSEILNSERPDPFMQYGGEVEQVEELDQEEKDKEQQKKKKKSKIRLQPIADRQAVMDQFKILIAEFEAQDRESPTSFSYSTLTSFLKATREEKKHRKRKKKLKQQRKKRTKNPRKVRFK